MNIALIGFRGTGKTTIGKKLARRLDMDFVDIDKEIFRKEGKSIEQIFAQKTEAGFRELEKEAVALISGTDNMCIACGGGVVLAAQNIDNLKKNSTIILLEASPKAIYERIRHDKNRPSLTDKKGIDEVVHLLNERKPLYESAARFRFDTTKDSVEDTVQKIIDTLNGE